MNLKRSIFCEKNPGAKLNRGVVLEAGFETVEQEDLG
jgi:hypothetical protein